jgi:hypothetical protein
MINPQKGIDLMNNTSIINRILFAVTIIQQYMSTMLGEATTKYVAICPPPCQKCAQTHHFINEGKILHKRNVRAMGQNPPHV